MATLLDTGPQLLLDWREPDEGSRRFGAGVISVVLHAVAILLLPLASRLDFTKVDEVKEPPPLKQYTRLIAPRLTQKEPNREKVAKEVKLENLLPQPEVRQEIPAAPVAPRKTFEAPTATAPAPKQPTQPALPEPPKYEASLKALQALPHALRRSITAAPPPMPEPPKPEASLKPLQALPEALRGSMIAVPPPKIQAEEKPKLVLENPGQAGSATVKGGVQAKIPVPKASVDEAIRGVARGGGQGGVVVGDPDANSGLPGSLRRPSPGRPQSSLELLSDPMGVDFKPYLIRVLEMVKRNWFAVFPESARLGLRGTVMLRFVVDRQGQVPKLTISMPSGATALDRAAVASISASIPLPQLPAEYKGPQIVLQFKFQYN